MDSNSILAALGKVGKLFYDTMLGKLNSGKYPKGDAKRGFSSIQNATSVEAPIKEGDGYSVTIKIDLKKAPYAWAYEKGSGLHGLMGAKYPILPRNVPEMKFPLSDWPNFQPGLTKVAPNKYGVFALTKVSHPGVEEKPYIEPTITQINDEVKKILAQEFKASSLREGRK
jgi:hypothetical protein